MQDIKEQDIGFGFVHETVDFFPGSMGSIPPLRLAGIDEDDIAEPHVVRGID
ncbi:hypothetical protein [Streptomyces sp. NPDC090132]|uniref:hypothetical protein n=1 Tax=Streptomyces sp. NPDC090132 TaxID=3365955 RepID=UPI0038231073